MSKLLKTVDFSIYLLPIIFIVISIALIYSLVFSGDDSLLALRQGLFAGLGIILMLVFSFIDYRSYKGLWWIFYFVALILLLYVDFFGHVSGGAMRWISIGFFNLQPSEIAKLAVIISLATFFSGKIGKMVLKDYIGSLILVALPLILIFKEPDFGTAMIVSLIYFILLLCSRPNKKQLFIIFSTVILFLAIFFMSVYNLRPFGSLLHDYQRQRVFSFIDPSSDPLGQGYNVRQAQISIGSGGLLGKGLGQGSQSQLKFLPKPQTDFIFSGVGEALGFVGAGLVVLLFIYLIVRIFTIASVSQDNFGMLVCIGTGAVLLFQAAINIGMNLGLAPVTGIPLPFLSYGGTALITYLLLLGIVQNIYIRHRKINF